MLIYIYILFSIGGTIVLTQDIIEGDDNTTAAYIVLIFVFLFFPAFFAKIIIDNIK
jgi:hypothetical protein